MAVKTNFIQHNIAEYRAKVSKTLVYQMNSRNPIWATQRSGPRRRQGQCEHLEEDSIEAEVEVNRTIRRQTIEVEGSSPSTRRVHTRACSGRRQ